jgi:hypothetical protein
MKDSTGVVSSIGIDKTKINAGKGVIVDSGTTDTYLPRSIAASFKTLYKKIGGLDHNNNALILTAAQIARLPILIFRLEGLKGQPHIDIQCGPESYLESLSKGKYANRVYTTEPSGLVLGANFMNNHDVVFDPDNLRIGFAESECKESQRQPAATLVVDKKKKWY